MFQFLTFLLPKLPGEYPPSKPRKGTQEVTKYILATSLIEIALAKSDMYLQSKIHVPTLGYYLKAFQIILCHFPPCAVFLSPSFFIFTVH